MKIRKMYLVNLIDLKGLGRFNLVLSKEPELKEDKPLIIYFGKPGETLEDLEVRIKEGEV